MQKIQLLPVEKWDEVFSPQKLLWFESTNLEQKNKKRLPQ
jgi:hypothetical protein